MLGYDKITPRGILPYALIIRPLITAFHFMIPNSLKNKFTFSINLSALALLGALLIGPNAQAKHLLIFGDSLSAAYGMELDQGWAHLLSNSLAKEHTVTNASISGETSGGGLARFELTINEFKPDLILLELGANDGLQGLSINALRDNLSKMIEIGRNSGAQVIIAGISLPASYGPRYIDMFRATFKNLASKYELPFIDFYREEFFTQPGYIQADGLHPTVITQTLIRDLVLEFLNNHKLLD